MYEIIRVGKQGLDGFIVELENMVAAYYRAKHIVLYEWEKERKSQFKILDGTWKPVEATEIFG